MDLIFLFPGQSSRYGEMIPKLRGLSPSVDAHLDHASTVLGRDLPEHYRSDSPAVFATNRDIQIGVFLANHLYLELLREQGVHARLSAGLSLGEYNHLVHIGALAFEDALRLVDARGAAYDRGPSGVMACVFPVTLEELTPVVERAQAAGCVEIANLNSPTQYVLSGERPAVDSALRLLEAEHCVEGIVIEQRVPMHCSLFAPVAEVFRRHLESAPWRPARGTYLPNVTAEMMRDPAPSLYVEMLRRHVFQPVRWRDSIEALADSVPDPVFVEVGPRAVLSNLLHKKWRPFRKHRTDGAEDLAGSIAHFRSLVDDLTRLPLHA